MATVDTIRNITIQASTSGVDQATDSLNKLSDAQSGVSQSGASMATVTDTSASKQLSAQGAYDKLRTSIDSQYKSQQQLAKGESVLTNALNQGVITTAQYAQMHDLLTAKYSTNTTLSAAFGNAIGGVKNQMIALSAGMGPVGVFLASFGPWGLAAAAGVGLITAALDYMVEEANRMGDVAAQLRNVSEATGLSTDNLQKLDMAGAEVGMTAQQVGTSFERFEVQMGSLRDGTGTLYTDLMKVNPALVSQMASTKDAATAWNLLAQAYAMADQQQQALIAHAAAGGRNGTAGAGNLLTATNAAGGIQGLQTPADLLSSDQVTQFAQLKTQIDATNLSAKNLIASLYASDVLSAEKTAADGYLAMAQGLKAIADQQQGMSWFEKFLSLLGQADLNMSGGGAIAALGSAIPTLSDAAAGGMAGVGSASGVPGSSSSAPNPQFMAAQWKAYTTALGAAATLTDQFNDKWAALSAAFDKGGISVETYNRALAGLQLETQVQMAQAYVSALGPLASVQDQVNAKMLSVQATVMKGIPLTDTQVQQIKNLTQANDEWSRVQEISATGVADLGLATKAAGDQLQAWIDEKLIDPTNTTQMAAAQAVLAAKITAVGAAAYDATPSLKALHDAQFTSQTQFMSPSDQAAANAAKQIDPTNWMAHINDAGPALARFNTQLKQAADLGGDFANSFGQAMLQGQTATQALNTALNSLASSLISMISKQLVNQALGGLMGTVGGLGGSAIPSSGVVGMTVASAMGNVFSNGRIIHAFGLGDIVSDIVTRPTMFPMANGTGLMGEAGPEAVMPLTRMSGGQLGVRAGGGSGGGGVSVVNTITIQNNSGSPATQTQQKNSSGGTDTRITIGAMMNERVGSGALDKVMASRYGVKPVTQVH
jgi:lambda family phage tail tape measure protein